MASLPIPERAVVSRARSSLLQTEQELLDAISALQTPIPDRWMLEKIKLFLNKLPPAQPRRLGILPQFNLGSPLQSRLSSLAPPSFIPQRTITPVKESNPRVASAATTAKIKRVIRPPVHEPYKRRLAELKNLLRPLTHENDDSGCVMLCWGSSSSCRVLAVNHIGPAIDQELFWNKLQTAWYNTRGRWRQNMPWYGIRSVKQVKIRLVGPDPKAKDLFYGVYQPADKALETEKRKLRESMSTFSEYDPEQYPDIVFPGDIPCWYDHRSGHMVHNEDTCILYLIEYDDDFNLTCDVEEHYRNRERLTKMKMESLRTLLFQNPKMAVYNELDNAELVYSSK